VRVSDNNKAKFRKITAHSARDQNHDITQAELAALWIHEAEPFSGKDITHVCDQIPALSGLTKRCLSSEMTALYLAGTWLANANRELAGVRWCQLQLYHRTSRPRSRGLLLCTDRVLRFQAK